MKLLLHTLTDRTDTWSTEPREGLKRPFQGKGGASQVMLHLSGSRGLPLCRPSTLHRLSEITINGVQEQTTPQLEFWFLSTGLVFWPGWHTCFFWLCTCIKVGKCFQILKIIISRKKSAMKRNSISIKRDREYLTVWWQLKRFLVNSSLIFTFLECWLTQKRSGQTKKICLNF